MTVPTVAILVALSTLVPVQAAAECLGLPLRDQKKHADFILEATVTQLVPLDGNEIAAEIQTHQVWKGKIPTTTSVHFVPTLDGPHLKPGVRYVILGVPETDRHRKDFVLAGEAHKGVIWVLPCAGAWISSPDLVRQLGRSKKPTQDDRN